MELNLKQNGNDDIRPETSGGHAVEPLGQLDCMRQALRKNLNQQVQFMMRSCVSCGLCAQSCHYYCADPDSELIPANKFKKLAKILQKHFHPLRSRLPGFKQSDLPEAQMITSLYRAAYENCTLCGKCALTCPMGINTGEILYLAQRSTTERAILNGSPKK